MPRQAVAGRYFYPRSPDGCTRDARLSLGEKTIRQPRFVTSYRHNAQRDFHSSHPILYRNNPVFITPHVLIQNKTAIVTPRILLYGFVYGDGVFFFFFLAGTSGVANIHLYGTHCYKYYRVQDICFSAINLRVYDRVKICMRHAQNT